MTRNRVLLAAVVLVAGCAVASAQEPGAGKLEVGGWPGGGIFFTGGDDQYEVNFNTWAYGGDLSYYLTPLVGVEAELSYGLGLAQGVNYKGKEVFHVQVPNTLQTSANLILYPGGTQGTLVPYVTGGVGLLTLISRDSTKQFGLTSAESFMAENVGGGVKIFRSGDAQNWGFRVDYRFILINSKSGAVPFFAQSTSRRGQRVYIGMLYTMTR
jgi:hypothetical protein